MNSTLHEVSHLLPSGVPESKYKQFRDVQGWFAWLLKLCLAERKHLNTKRGQKAVEEYQQTLSPALVIDNLKMWHTYFVMFILTFHEAGWKDLNLSGLPKMPDYILLALTKHQFFDGLDIAIITKNFRLLAKEKKVLKEVASRLSP